MSSFHDPSAATQNCGNHIGSRPSVRLYSSMSQGNNMQSLLGGGGSATTAFKYTQRKKVEVPQVASIEKHPSERGASANMGSLLSQNSRSDNTPRSGRRAAPPAQVQPAQKAMMSNKWNRNKSEIGDILSHNSAPRKFTPAPIMDVRTEDSPWATSNGSYGKR